MPCWPQSELAMASVLPFDELWLNRALCERQPASVLASAFQWRCAARPCRTTPRERTPRRSPWGRKKAPRRPHPSHPFPVILSDQRDSHPAQRSRQPSPDSQRHPVEGTSFVTESPMRRSVSREAPEPCRPVWDQPGGSAPAHSALGHSAALAARQDRAAATAQAHNPRVRLYPAGPAIPPKHDYHRSPSSSAGRPRFRLGST
jgi:hypothetical protein